MVECLVLLHVEQLGIKSYIGHYLIANTSSLSNNPLTFAKFSSEIEPWSGLYDVKTASGL